MKKHFFFIMILVIITSSCNKILDYYHNHKGDNAASCKILSLSYKDSVSERKTEISYNAAGYPESVTYTSSDIYTSGPPLTYIFNYKYDVLNRLISETSDWVYTQNIVYYAYEGNSKVPVRDTIPGLFGDIYVEDLESDNLGRITKVTKRIIQNPEDPIDFPTEVHKYYYDGHGNRQEDPSNAKYPGVIVYNNKPSLYTLHPVWNIIHKDYSKNSVSYGETYNDKGFPLTIKRGNADYFQPFLDMLPGDEIDYDCTD
ncbi:MAG: hypothetical protein H0X41_04755 [Chitinophagaceae bacterium]|nr:hypothetical protein [Chitinophagaceae bacterium]